MLANLLSSALFSFPSGSEDPSRLWNCHNKGSCPAAHPSVPEIRPEHCLSFPRVSSCVGFVSNHPVSDPYFDPLAHVPLHPDELWHIILLTWLNWLLINFLPPDSPMYAPVGTLPGSPSTLADSCSEQPLTGDELISIAPPTSGCLEGCRKQFCTNTCVIKLYFRKARVFIFKSPAFSINR